MNHNVLFLCEDRFSVGWLSSLLPEFKVELIDSETNETDLSYDCVIFCIENYDLSGFRSRLNKYNSKLFLLTSTPPPNDVYFKVSGVFIKQYFDASILLPVLSRECDNETDYLEMLKKGFPKMRDEILAEMLATFVVTRQEDIKQLKQELQDDRSGNNNAHLVIHKIKGSSLLIGFNYLAYLAMEIEMFLKAKLPPSLKALEKLNNFIDDLMKLSEHLSNKKND